MGLTSTSTGAGAADTALVLRRERPDDRIVALAGNPNVGKSTVFNALTGLRQHTGNWPGKTVTSAQGRCERGGRGYVLVDLPGTYSLMAHSAEEEVARDFLCFGGADGAVVVCDATCLERNLNLVLQTLELQPRTVVCVNLLDEAERKGLGTPATRAAIIEKLVSGGFVERKGKNLIPTKAGVNLVTVLPELLTSPKLTADWEQRLNEVAKGQASPEDFMDGIEAMATELVRKYSHISEDGQKLFQPERETVGICPRCSKPVYEGKKNYYCGNRACQFVMWKNDRFFEERGKTFTPKIAAALLKDGKAKVKGLRSMKTGKTYDGTVLLADTGGKYVNYRMEKKS